MSSSDNKHQLAESQSNQNSFSSAPVLLGIALLLLAAFLGWWGLSNYPRHRHSTEDIAPAEAFPAPVVTRPAEPQASSGIQSPATSTPKPTPRRNLNHAAANDSAIKTEFPVALTMDPAPVQSPTPIVSASPTPSASPTADRQPNIIRRFFNWFIHLFKRKENNAPEVLAVTPSLSHILRPCPPKTSSPDCTPTDSSVTLFAKASDPDNDQLLYTWSVTGGRLSGEGREVTWDLAGVTDGTYTATVEVNDGNQHTSNGSATVTVSECTRCFRPPPPCPNVSVSCPSDVEPNRPIRFTANVTEAGGETLNYHWSLSAGTIATGQGTSTIIVNTIGLGGQNVTATLSLGGADPCTSTTQSCTTSVKGSRTEVPIQFSGRLLHGFKPITASTGVAVASNDREYLVRFDQNGVFTLALPPGRYRLIVVPRGFRPQSLDFEVRPDTTNLDLSLPVEAVTPTPTPSPGEDGHGPPLGTPSPTPAATPSPITESSKEKVIVESDRITATYRDRLLRGVDNRVSLDLERVIGEVEREVKVDPATKTVTLVDVPDSLPGSLPHLVTPINPVYDTYVTIRLTGDGLVVPPDQESQTKLYKKAYEDPQTKPKQNWNWDVQPADGAAIARLHFEMFVTWKSATPGVPDRPPVKVKDLPIPEPIPVGKFGVAVYGSIVSSPFVFLAGAGVIRKGSRRRKKASDPVNAASAAPKPDGDEVSSMVYAPRDVRRGDSFQVDVFLQLEDASTDLAERMAKMGDEASTLRDVSPLATRIAKGTTLTFHLMLPGLKIQNPDQSGTWDSKLLRVRFNVSVPTKFKPKKVIATIIIADQSVPIGHLSFTLNVVRADAAPSKEDVLNVKVKAYKQAFISYASSDRVEVTKRVQILDLLEIPFFQDLLTLEPGKEFEPTIYQYIDRSDVFFLFWSKAARRSRWVNKELRYAVKRKAGEQEAPPAIIPVIIEGPPPAKPPWSLRKLHFNDKMIYFIHSVDKRDEASDKSSKGRALPQK